MDSPSVYPQDEQAGFVVRLENFQGTTEQLLTQINRGEVDVASVPMAAITQQYRAFLRSHNPQLTDIGEFVMLMSRLLAAKSAHVLPGDSDQDSDDMEASIDDNNAGERLAEYRLFKAAADMLLQEVGDEGVRSFLGLVVPEPLPTERLLIAPERLAAAFRGVLERFTDAVPLPVGAATFSVHEKVQSICTLLQAHSTVLFADIFASAKSRLEAVACFLALLELLKRGEALVAENEAGEISIRLAEQLS